MISISRGILLTLLFISGILVTQSGCPKRTDSQTPSSQSGDVAGATPSREDVQRHNEGVALMGQFDYAQAFAVFDELATKYPKWVDVRVDREIARLNRQQGDDDQVAGKQLAEIVAAHPENLRATYCRGILCFNSGKSQEAAEHFRRVLDEDPRDAYATYYAAQCLLDSGEAEKSLELFAKAQALDPYFRSAYYGAFQAYQRLGKRDDAAAQLQQFTRLSNNPQARLAEIAYTRMGPKAEVLVTALPNASQPKTPTGPLFAAAEPLVILGDSPVWRPIAPDDVSQINVTTCDMNGDGRLDLFLAGAAGTSDHPTNIVLLQRDEGWSYQPTHALADIDNVQAALWGDFDNDLRNDVYLCRRGANQLWRQSEQDEWLNVTEATGTAGGELHSVDGAVFDADHDGDLDIFVVNQNGPNELLNNNRDGTFRALGEEQSLQGSAESSQQMVVADWDSDRDADLLVLNTPSSHDVYSNDRLWNYQMATGWDTFRDTEIWAAVAGDTNVDGKTELYTAGPDGLAVWQANDEDKWTSKPVDVKELSPQLTRPVRLMLQDLSGDGSPELVVATAGKIVVIDRSEAKVAHTIDEPLATEAILVNLDVATGPALVVPQRDGPPRRYPPGQGRFDFAQLAFTGKDDEASQMRTNASGIGVQASARILDRWSWVPSFRNCSGVGQSLQPAAIGVALRPSVDFVYLRWPDGLVQSELNLPAKAKHAIAETQRQVSSCPVVFAWDGTAFQFVTDVLGVGGIGFNVGRGEYPSPRPWENLLLPTGLLHPNGANQYELRIGEPMEEAMYLDAIHLAAYDLPSGWSMVLDERFAVDGPQPTGRPVYYRREQLPSRAHNQDQDDVTAAIQVADHRAAPIPPVDARFIGRTETHQLLLTFDHPVDDGTEPLWLVFDGWVEYPYSQTMFAAWQAGADYQAPTVEALDAAGTWHVVLDHFGYMAGMPRRSAVPLDRQKLPARTQQLRITTNLEIYWDRIALISEEPCPAARRYELPLVAAEAARSGFARRIDHPQRRPDYDYQHRVPLWDTQHQTGRYTNFGDALPLMVDVDDACAILGPGEEIQLRYAAQLPSRTDAVSRQFVLECYGWCKDRDLYTQSGDTIDPLPMRDGVGSGLPEASLDLMRKYNQRFHP